MLNGEKIISLAAHWQQDLATLPQEVQALVAQVQTLKNLLIQHLQAANWLPLSVALCNLVFQLRLQILIVLQNEPDLENILPFRSLEKQEITPNLASNLYFSLQQQQLILQEMGQSENLQSLQLEQFEETQFTYTLFIKTLQLSTPPSFYLHLKEFMSLALSLEALLYAIILHKQAEITLSDLQQEKLSIALVQQTQRYMGLARVLGFVKKSKPLTTNHLLTPNELRQEKALAEQGMQDYKNLLSHAD